MSDDGRTFFSTPDAQIPATPTGSDVYEFGEGRPQLITTGSATSRRPPTRPAEDGLPELVGRQRRRDRRLLRHPRHPGPGESERPVHHLLRRPHRRRFPDRSSGTALRSRRRVPRPGKRHAGRANVGSKDNLGVGIERILVFESRRRRSPQVRSGVTRPSTGVTSATTSQPPPPRPTRWRKAPIGRGINSPTEHSNVAIDSNEFVIGRRRTFAVLIATVIAAAALFAALATGGPRPSRRSTQFEGSIPPRPRRPVATQTSKHCESGSATGTTPARSRRRAATAQDPRGASSSRRLTGLIGKPARDPEMLRWLTSTSPSNAPPMRRPRFDITISLNAELPGHDP